MLLDVIFLDIDGVLNPDKDKYPHVFAPDCVQQLRRILDASPQIHVVFSTSWRTGFPFFVLGWLWHQHDLPVQRVIGRTPDIQNDRRGEEIQKWLSDAPLRTKEHQVRRFAALDDEPEPILEVIEPKHVFICDPWHALNDPTWTEEKAHAQAARNRKDLERRMADSLKSNPSDRRRAIKSPTGRVGIFWVFRGKVLAATYALPEGEQYGDAINGLTDHVKYWSHFQKLHLGLRGMEYQDVPRGRVLFMKPTGTFHVYMDKVLHNLKTKRALLKEFELPKRSTQFLLDAHYTTDSDDLEKLFF